MTYNVYGGMLNLTQPNYCLEHTCIVLCLYCWISCFVCQY